MNTYDLRSYLSISKVYFKVQDSVICELNNGYKLKKTDLKGILRVKLIVDDNGGKTLFQRVIIIS
jgi:hypothetical protein